MKEEIKDLIKLLKKMNKSYEEEDFKDGFVDGVIYARKIIIDDLEKILKKHKGE